MIELPQLAIMETVFQENLIIKMKEVNKKMFVEVEEIMAPKQTIFDPKDTSLKLGVKGKIKWVGSKCHVLETAEKGRINFITGVIQQEAHLSDHKIHPKLKKACERQELEPAEIYVDQNYISATELANYEKRGQQLMGYAAKNASKKVEGFKLHNFKIDMRSLTAICPNNKKSVRYKRCEKTRKYQIYFSKDDCQACPFYDQCVGTTKLGKRKIQVSMDYHYLRKRRQKQKTERFKKRMKVRAQIEGTISELVRSHGFRKIKYKGETRRQFQLLLSATALNTKRYIRAITNGLQITPSAIS